MPDAGRVREVARLLWSAGLLNDAERAGAAAVVSPVFPFAGELLKAESVHLHIKVDNAGEVPQVRLDEWGWTVVLSRPGLVVLDAGAGASVTFSSVAISEDDLSAEGRARARPFLDHIGIDLPEASAVASARARADGLRWATVRQGGDGRAVACCYALAAEKVWAFPPAPDGVPIEFSFGAGGSVRGARPRPAPVAPAAIGFPAERRRWGVVQRGRVLLPTARVQCIGAPPHAPLRIGVCARLRAIFVPSRFFVCRRTPRSYSPPASGALPAPTNWEGGHGHTQSGSAAVWGISARPPAPPSLPPRSTPGPWPEPAQFIVPPRLAPDSRPNVPEFYRDLSKTIAVYPSLWLSRRDQLSLLRCIPAAHARRSALEFGSRALFRPQK